MRKGFYFIGLALFAIVISAAIQSPDEPQFVKGELLVKFSSGVTTQAIEASISQLGAQSVEEMSAIGVRKLKIVTTQSVKDAVQKFSELPNVVYAEPNYIYHTLNTPNDPSFGKLWGMHNTGQTGGLEDADIDAPEAWDITTGSDQVIIGVIDTGVDYKHADLAANIYTNPGEDAWTIPGDPSSGNGVDDDGNGKIDDWKGWNFISDSNNPMDDNMHGTHVSGTIGAVGANNVGVVGVNWTVRIMPLKFLGSDGSGDTDDAIKAIIYATDMGAKVLSNSWGGGGYSSALEDAIKYANDHGVLFVAAAGNDGVNTDITPNYPSNYDVANIISVAASDHSDQRALWGSGGGGGDGCGLVCSKAVAATPGSNYGPKTVDLAAPGKDIYSTVPGGYSSLSGTSMATPHVAGAAGLLLAKSPDMTAQQIKDRLISTVDVLPAFENIVVSGGRLNVANALQGL